MLIPPRIIYYPLNHSAMVELSHWGYYEHYGLYGAIKVDFGTDKFSWTPTIERVNLKPSFNDDQIYTIPLFRYDSSRKNMKPMYKWTKKQSASFFNEYDRPYDLIGYFDIRYEIDKVPVIIYNPWERIPYAA